MSVRASEAGPGSERTVVLGRFGAPFGVQGWVKLESYTEPPEQVLDYPALQGRTVGRRDRRPGVEAGRPRPARRAARRSREPGRGRGRCAVPSSGCDGRTCRPRRPGEYYFADLIGLTAVNREGDALGQVAEILELPAHPVLVLRGERERLVPLVRERLIRVDLDAGRVTLDWHRDD